MAEPLAIAAEVQRLIDAGRPAQAEALLRRALARNANDPTLNQVMALLMTRLARPEQAVHFASRAAAAAPDAAELHYTLGLCLSNTPALDKARDAFLRAIALAPSEAKHHLAIAKLDVDAFRPAQAEAALAECLRLAPGWPPAVTLLAQLRTICGRAGEALAMLRDAAREHPLDRDLHHLLCVTMQYASGVGNEEALAAHRRTAQLIPSAPPTPPAPRPADQPLRVGFLSGDLKRHAVAHFLEPLLEHRRHAGFEAICYSESGVSDDVTLRLKAAADAWRTTTQLDDAALERQMRADRLDVLIDLTGHLAPQRMKLLSRRPAPLIVNWLAYPDTSGLDAVGVRLVDAHTDPPGAERWAAERLVRISPCFLCYRPEPQALAVRPRAPGAPPTFGSFNNAAKLSDATVELWSALLRRIPASRLLLKAANLHEPTVASGLRARFAAHGVREDRIEIAGRTPGVAEHLGLYHGVDVALDPTPYNGTTTTCEALWMGVPVVTLAGNRHAARVGVSLLSTVGLPELVADSPGRYIDLAATLIANAPRLAHLRSNLREQVRRSPLCDGAAFACAFGTALDGFTPKA